MKPAALGAALIIFGVLGALLVAATPEDGQWPVAAIVAVLLALALGGLWPVRREFTIAGVAIGLLFAVGISTYIVISIWSSNSFYYDRVGRSRGLVQAIFAGFAIFGGWTFVMMVGAAAGWLIQLITRRPAVARPTV